MNGQYDPGIHHRQSIRLKGYDYSQCGAYFVTICVHNRGCLFGAIADGKMQLNEIGVMVQHGWEWLPQQYPYVAIDAFVVMPNHFHGILTITDVCEGDSTGKRKPLGRLVGVFKTITTKGFNEMWCCPVEKLWQRNYYEHIIRGDNDYLRIAEYIQTNPFNWENDPLWTNP